MTSDDRIKELEKLIRRYQKSYYNGEAEISDQEFDALWDELGRIAPDSPVLGSIGKDSKDGFPKIKHLIPMGSQEKAANPDDFLSWAEKTAAKLYAVQYKMDGASLELQYENGKLIHAVTRGDGIIGDDITANALRMQGVLAKLNLPFSGGVRGEVMLFRDIWQERYSDKANCRNAANGVMRRKDGKGCEDLTLICYDVTALDEAAGHIDNYFPSEKEKLAWLDERGFKLSPCTFFKSASEIVEYRSKVAALRPELPYDIDGLVVKDNETDLADLRRTRPERQIAFKFELEAAVSVLTEVEWSTSGATYTPIGIIDPVRLAGTTVKRANLNNPDMIRSMKLHIGSKVLVVKRGEIIPKIEGLAPGLQDQERFKPIHFPVRCELCSSELVDAGTRLYCPNPDCPKRLHHRLEKWITVLDIREFGDVLLKRLFEKGRLTRVSDLYTLDKKDFSELERMGEISAAKVLRHLRSPRRIPLARFIAGFDFEGIGETIMEKLVTAGFDNLEALRKASVEEIASVHGLGTISARIIVDGLKETREDMDAVLEAGIIRIAAAPSAESQPLRGFSFCITGELRSMKRSAAEEKIKQLGGLVKNSVVKDLSYLINNDPASGSSKNKKAKALNIPIIDEDKFLKLLEDPASVENKQAAGQGELF